MRRAGLRKSALFSKPQTRKCAKSKKHRDMKWLSLDFIKQHSRIDYDCEDALLEMYGDSAEESIMNICNRSYEDLKVMGGGKIPANLYHAGVILVDNSYTNRGAVSVTAQNAGMYGIDLLLKNYIKLTT